MFRSSLAVCLAAAVLLTTPSTPQEVVEKPHTRSAQVRLTVNPGELVRWRSPRIGRVERLSITIDGAEPYYTLTARTRACVANAYASGVAVRLTDCRRGRRVPYVRLRAVSAALKPVRVTLRLYGSRGA